VARPSVASVPPFFAAPKESQINETEFDTNESRTFLAIEEREQDSCVLNSYTHALGFAIFQDNFLSRAEFVWGVNSPDHSATLTISVDPGRTGKLTYYYGTSTKGGSAEIFIDGASRGTVNYNGSSGGIKDPVFGAKIEFANLAPGQHKVEIKNMSDTVYVDRFCLESSASTGQSTSGPGNTATTTSNLSAGQQLLNSLPVASGATAISVVAASNNNLPIKLALISPSGAVLQVAESTNGVAVINAPITQSGTYIVKTINLSLGPVQVWTAATPTVKR